MSSQLALGLQKMTTLQHESLYFRWLRGEFCLEHSCTLVRVWHLINDKFRTQLCDTAGGGAIITFGRACVYYSRLNFTCQSGAELFDHVFKFVVGWLVFTFSWSSWLRSFHCIHCKHYNLNVEIFYCFAMFLESYVQWKSIIDATYFQLTLGVIVDIWLLKQYLYLPSMCAAKVYFPLLSRSPEWTIFPSGPVSFVYKVKKCVIKAA